MRRPSYERRQPRRRPSTRRAGVRTSASDLRDRPISSASGRRDPQRSLSRSRWLVSRDQRGDEAATPRVASAWPQLSESSSGYELLRGPDRGRSALGAAALSASCALLPVHVVMVRRVCWPVDLKQTAEPSWFRSRAYEGVPRPGRRLSLPAQRDDAAQDPVAASLGVDCDYVGQDEPNPPFGRQPSGRPAPTTRGFGCMPCTHTSCWVRRRRRRVVVNAGLSIVHAHVVTVAPALVGNDRVYGLGGEGIVGLQGFEHVFDCLVER